MNMHVLSYADPFDALQRLQREIERAYDTPYGFGQGLSGRGAFPPVNVFQSQDGYVARMEVPGLTSKDVSVESHGRTLTVRGRRELARPENGSVHRQECWSGAFSRSVQFPEDADLARAAARCKHGVLTIEVPQREEAKPRRIEVAVD